MLRHGVPLEKIRVGPAAPSSMATRRPITPKADVTLLKQIAQPLAGESLSDVERHREAYLALRRAAGFAMLNGEYLLKSFAAFATERGQTHVHTQTQSIGRRADRLSRNAMPG